MVKWLEWPTSWPVNALCSPVTIYKAPTGQQPRETGSARGSSDRGEGLEEAAGGRPWCCPGRPEKRQGGKKSTYECTNQDFKPFSSEELQLCFQQDRLFTMSESQDMQKMHIHSVTLFIKGFADRWARAEETETWGQKPSHRMPTRENTHQKPHSSQGGKSSSGGKGLNRTSLPSTEKNRSSFNVMKLATEQ